MSNKKEKIVNVQEKIVLCNRYLTRHLGDPDQKKLPEKGIYLLDACVQELLKNKEDQSRT